MGAALLVRSYGNEARYKDVRLPSAVDPMVDQQRGEDRGLNNYHKSSVDDIAGIVYS